MRVGVISDTHGRLDPRVLELFQGVDHILHAGDIGSAAVLEGLRSLAPVTAVRGNVDLAPWASALPLEESLELAGRHLLVGHIREDLLRRHDPLREGLDAVVFGHTHQPLARVEAGVLYLNPGSAGPRRFHLPRAAALLHLDGRDLRPELVVLEEGAL